MSMTLTGQLKIFHESQLWNATGSLEFSACIVIPLLYAIKYLSTPQRRAFLLLRQSTLCFLPETSQFHSSARPAPRHRCTLVWSHKMTFDEREMRVTENRCHVTLSFMVRVYVEVAHETYIVCCSWQIKGRNFACTHDCRLLECFQKRTSGNEFVVACG